MPRDANGNTQPLAGTIVSTGDTILPSQHNPMVNDVYAMMTQSLSRDGQGGMRANLDMSNFRAINVGAATGPNDAVILSQINALSPLGIPLPYLGSVAPSGYILCAGQAISRTVYAALFAILGVQYGAGDGTTTFNIPDLRGRSISGLDNMGGTAASRITLALSGIDGTVLGASGGLQVVTLTTPQIPSHTHTGTTDLQGQHIHSITGGTSAGSGVPNLNYTLATQNPSGAFTTDPSGIHGHNLNIASTGGGGAHPNMQPTILTNYILRTGV